MQRLRLVAAVAALSLTSMASAASRTIDFNDGTSGFATLTQGVIVEGTQTNVYAQPFGDGSRYLAGNPSGTARLDFGAADQFQSFSFLHGSVDSFNSLDVFGSDGGLLKTFTFRGNGDQGADGTRTFYAGGLGKISALQFNSSQPNFELDNLSVNAVPEPSTWAMLIAGFGMVGFASRRRANAVAA